MSSQKTCSQRNCKKAINIKNQAYFTFLYPNNIRKEYICSECGIRMVQDLYNEGSYLTIKDYMKYFSSEGEERSGADLVEALTLLNLVGIEKLRAMEQKQRVSV